MHAKAMASAKKESKFFDILKTQLSHTCPLNQNIEVCAVYVVCAVCDV